MSLKVGPPRSDDIGPWSQEKLDLLEKYLVAYAIIMNKQKKSWLKAFHYIDAFAGSPYQFAKDLQDYIAGSSIRALQTVPHFDCLWFIELSPWRIDKLNCLKEDYPDCQIKIYRNDCNQIIQKELVNTITLPSKQRGLIFLDPYGLQVQWDSIIALSEAGTFDVFINFPVMAITRLLPKKGLPDSKTVNKIRKIIGDDEWLNIFYKEDPQMQIFGEDPQIVRSSVRANELALIYTKKLKKIFSHVSDPIIMYNSKNSALYALCVASHKKTAININNSIFKNHEILRAQN